MSDSHLKIFGYPFEASWPSLLPTAPPLLDNVAAPPIWDSSTVQTDPFSLPNGQLMPSTMADASGTGQTAPTTEPNHSHHDAKHIPGGIRGQFYDMSSSLGQQEPPLFPHAPNLSLGSPHMPTNAEVQIRGKVADREVQINAVENFIKHLRDTFEADGREKDAALQPLIDYLYSQTISIQKEIADRLNAFSAERQKAEAAVSAEVANLEAQIHILKQENYHDASALTAMANTHSCTG